MKHDKKWVAILFILCFPLFQVIGETQKLASDSNNWEVLVYDGNKLTLTKDKGLLLKYNMPVKGQWVQIEQNIELSFEDITRVELMYKGTGANNDIEIKFEDINDSNFGLRYNKATSRKKWINRKIPIKRFKYLWGGDKKKNTIKKIYIAISGQGDGDIYFKKIDIITKKKKQKNTQSLKKLKSFKKYQLKNNLDKKILWQLDNDKGSKISLNQVKGIYNQALKIDYQLKPNSWVIIRTKFDKIPDRTKPLTFFIKADAGCDFDIKFIDEDGSEFGRKVSLAGKYKEWTPMAVYMKNVEYWWNGDKKFSGLKTLELGFAGTGRGKIYLDEMGINNKKLTTSLSPAGPQLDPNRDLEGFGFKQRRHKKLKKENPLVLKGLKIIQDTSSPKKMLLPSMEDNQAQTFNNVLVAMAFIIKNERKRAERILDFFASATIVTNKNKNLQNFYYKGEARGFFQEVSLRKTKKSKAYHHDGNSDRWMGDMCYMLFAYKLHEKKYKSKRYNKMVKLLSDLLISWYKEINDGEMGYVQDGWRKGDKKLHEQGGHPEGNIDAYAVFKLIGEEEKAMKIKRWLDSVLDDRNNLPLDQYAWRVLAYGKEYGELLDIPEYDFRYRKTLKFNKKTIMGFYHGPDIEINNMWLDGIGHMACAYFSVGKKYRGNFYANQLDKFLINRKLNKTMTKALPYTPNKSGVYDWVDASKGNISVAAWYIFAKNKFNPLTLEIYK